MIALFEMDNNVFGLKIYIFPFQTKLTKLYVGFFDHNPEVPAQFKPTVHQTRAWQVALLEDMVALIQLREGKIRKEKAENILGQLNILITFSNIGIMSIFNIVYIERPR